MATCKAFQIPIPGRNGNDQTFIYRFNISNSSLFNFPTTQQTLPPAILAITLIAKLVDNINLRTWIIAFPVQFSNSGQEKPKYSETRYSKIQKTPLANWKTKIYENFEWCFLRTVSSSCLHLWKVSDPFPTYYISHAGCSWCTQCVDSRENKDGQWRQRPDAFRIVPQKTVHQRPFKPLRQCQTKDGKRAAWERQSVPWHIED